MFNNFLILSNTSVFKYFLLYVYSEGNLDSANKFNNISSKWRQIKSFCQSKYAQKLEMTSTLFSEILVAVAWAVLNL